MSQTLLANSEQKAQQAFATSPIYALRTLHIEQVGEALHVRGRVTSFYTKQLAQELLRSVAEGLQVVNHVEVELPQPR